MMKREKFEIANIHVPVKRRPAGSRLPEHAGEWTGDPHPGAADGDRLVLVHGLYRLEACKGLGEFASIGIAVNVASGPTNVHPQFAAVDPTQLRKPLCEPRKLGLRVGIA